MSQEVQTLPLKSLVLWTENPRDSIDPDAKDQDIVDQALEDKRSKWSLPKLADQMGGHYDFSELPTVVFHEKKPVVYDGNRRVILGKLKHSLVSHSSSRKFPIPDIPAEIPCNVCSEDIALENISRKHIDSGSWDPLERDIFMHRFMEEPKSAFLALEEQTGLISANPHLNKGFVKDEILDPERLRSLGFEIKKGKVFSIHSAEQSRAILADISQKVKNGDITTRKNRFKVFEVLNPILQETVETNRKKTQRLKEVKLDLGKKGAKLQRKTPRTRKKKDELFGGTLYLRIGDVSNLYRDICDLYDFYVAKKSTLSSTFASLVRMSLRLLCETAANDMGKKRKDFVEGNFDTAKATLSQDIKTTLASQAVNKSSIVQLLETGAHNYQASSNIEQTIAVSIIVGAILTITHGKEN